MKRPILTSLLLRECVEDVPFGYCTCLKGKPKPDSKFGIYLLLWFERAIAVFRHKPLKLCKVPEYPTQKLHYEGAEIQQSLMTLVQTFAPLDSHFMSMWNQSDHDISNPELANGWCEEDLKSIDADYAIFQDSQKADVFVTQQWIRLIIWQCALRKRLLSSSSTNPSMSIKYPLDIASGLINIVSRIPPDSITVHGLGIVSTASNSANLH